MTRFIGHLKFLVEAVGPEAAFARLQSLAQQIQDLRADVRFAEVSSGRGSALMHTGRPSRGEGPAAGLLRAAELVVARWETGDLAGAVRMLGEAIAELKAA